METRHRKFKDDLYAQLARVSRALASPKRLELIDLLAQTERPVEELARLTGMSVANTSQHLQHLRQAQLVTLRRQGLYAFYRLAGPEAFRIWQAIRDFGQTALADVDRLVQSYMTDRKDLEPITAAELLKRIRNDDVTVLDVRPTEEYRAGHIRGARSVPVDELEKHLKTLRRNQDVVAYCRGPYCVYADRAVSLLNSRGFRARRLDIGYPDWRSAGLPVSDLEDGPKRRKGKIVG